jgi:hypothetical protein
MTSVKRRRDIVDNRGTSSNDLNSIQNTSESDETITWTNVGEEADILFGFLISIFLISVVATGSTIHVIIFCFKFHISVVISIGFFSTIFTS